MSHTWSWYWRDSPGSRRGHNWCHMMEARCQDIIWHKYVCVCVCVYMCVCVCMPRYVTHRVASHAMMFCFSGHSVPRSLPRTKCLCLVIVDIHWPIPRHVNDIIYGTIPGNTQEVIGPINTMKISPSRKMKKNLSCKIVISMKITFKWYAFDQIVKNDSNFNKLRAQRYFGA